MNTPLFEAFLARLYVDPRLKEAFLADPFNTALKAGLTEEQARALEGIDRVGLEFAVISYEKKRRMKGKAS